MKRLVRKKKIALEHVLVRQQAQLDRLSQDIEKILTYISVSREVPSERIRVVTQKTIEEPKTDFEKTLNWTTNQVNQHLNSLDEPTLQEIINSALTGRPVPEKTGIKAKSSDMTNYLNDNYGTIVNPEEAWKVIGNVQKEMAVKYGVREVRDTKIVDQEMKKLA